MLFLPSALWVLYVFTAKSLGEIPITIERSASHGLNPNATAWWTWTYLWPTWSASYGKIIIFQSRFQRGVWVCVCKPLAFMRLRIKIMNSVNIYAWGLYASTSPTKRLACGSDITGDVQWRTCFEYVSNSRIRCDFRLLQVHVYLSTSFSCQIAAPGWFLRKH